jgi:hypothetical protein
VSEIYTVGFTGTRVGLSEHQRLKVQWLIKSHDRVVRGLHGDCVGADAEFDQICKDLGFETACLPCTFDNMRAGCATAIAEPKPPMQRNRDIVASADVVIACPPNRQRIKRGSGTWATIGFAERAAKPLYVVYPEGDIKVRREGLVSFGGGSDE